MKRHPRLRRLKHLLSALLLTVAGACPAAGPKLDITVVLSGDDHIYREVRDGLQTRLLQQPDLDITLDTVIVAETAAGNLALDDSELVVAVGTRATRAAFEQHSGIPLISTLIPRITYLAILEEHGGEPGSDIADSMAIYLDQPAERQLELCRQIAGDHASTGLIWGPTSVEESPLYRRAANLAGINLHTASIESGENPVPKLTRLLADTDIFLALYDAEALNPTTAKWLLYMAYKNRKPVVGFSRAYVDAGALAAVYSTPEQIARQAADYIVSFSRRNSLPASTYPEYFSIALNDSVARSIRITLPDEDTLHLAIERALAGSRKPSR